MTPGYNDPIRRAEAQRVRNRGAGQQLARRQAAVHLRRGTLWRRRITLSDVATLQVQVRKELMVLMKEHLLPRIAGGTLKLALF